MKKQLNYEQLVRRGKWLTRKFNFYYALSRVTRIGLHGFVLWRLRSISRAGEVHNRRVEQAAKEWRRASAIARKGGAR